MVGVIVFMRPAECSRSGGGGCPAVPYYGASRVVTTRPRLCACRHAPLHAWRCTRLLQVCRQRAREVGVCEQLLVQSAAGVLGAQVDFRIRRLCAGGCWRRVGGRRDGRLRPDLPAAVADKGRKHAHAGQRARQGAEDMTPVRQTLTRRIDSATSRLHPQARWDATHQVGPLALSHSCCGCNGEQAGRLLQRPAAPAESDRSWALRCSSSRCRGRV